MDNLEEAPKEAVPYKTAKELGLTQDQYCGLIKVREALADGTLVWHEDVPANARFAKIFNMAHWKTDQHCGTVGCLGGWAEALMSRGRGALFPGGRGQMPTEAVGELFFPVGARGLPLHETLNYYQTLTPQHAIKALDTYLKTGSPQWPSKV